MNGTKILMWMLAMVLVVFASACGGDDGENQDADVQEGDVPGEADGDVQDVHIEDISIEDIRPEEAIGDPVGDEVVEDITDGTEAEIPATVTITGQVWSYTLMMETQYYVQPEGGVDVTVEGQGITPGDLTATTMTGNCEGSASPWWDLNAPFDCGKFSISDVPTGVRIMLRAAGLGTTGPDTISKIFTAQEGDFVLLVVVSQELIDAMLDAWTITQNADNGMVVGLLASLLNPDSIYHLGDAAACPDAPESCVVSGFIGGATVDITPDPECVGCNNIVYFDSANYANTSRTATDPAQSLFFVTNSPPLEMTTPYTIATDAGAVVIEDTDFAVEEGTITYLLLMP